MQAKISVQSTISTEPQNMTNPTTNPLTSLVDAVAQETVQSRFRGNVFARQGLFIDREALRRGSDDLDVSELIQDSGKIRAHVMKHGSVKF